MKLLRTIRKFTTALPARYLKRRRSELNLRQKHLLEGEQNALEKLAEGEKELDRASKSLVSLTSNKNSLIEKFGKPFYDKVFRERAKELIEAEKSFFAWKDALKVYTDKILKTPID